MPYELEFTIRISVNSDEEAERITAAVYSGYAAEIMRIGVLYGQVPVVGGMGGQPMPPQQFPGQQEARQREPDIEIKRVESKVGSVIATDVEEPKPKRQVGIRGRKRLDRG